MAIATTSTRAGVIFYTDKPSFDLAASTTLLEDFEAFAPKDTILPFFTSNGVTYTGFAGTPDGNVFVASLGFNNFGAGVTQPTTSSILTAHGDEDFTATFATPILALGFDTYLNGHGPATVKVFNGNTLLDTYAYDPALDTKEYWGIVSTDPITSFRWTTTDGATVNTGIDNISVLAVPEPSTAMFGALAVAVALCRRMRIKQSEPNAS